MIMQIVLSEEKAKQHHLSIDECYAKLDDLFERLKIKKISKGLYQGYDFGAMSVAQVSVTQPSWFLKVVDSFKCNYLGDSLEYMEDCLESYYRVKKRYANYRVR